MTEPKNGGLAFPHHGGYPDDDPRNQIIGGGMTLRDWFAGQVIGGFAANGIMVGHMDVATKNAYAVADAMLVAREESK